jgi:hypothetical protein
MFSVNTAGSRAHAASADNPCFDDVDRCNGRVSRNVGVSDFIALRIFAMSAVAPRERSVSLRTSSATTAKPRPASYGIGLIVAEVGGSVS